MKSISLALILLASMSLTSCMSFMEGMSGVLTGGSPYSLLDPQTAAMASYQQWQSTPTGKIDTSPGYQAYRQATTVSSSSSSRTSSSSGKMCSLCAGSGQCKTCMGRGYYYSSFGTSTKISCPNCDRNHNGICSSCHGTGKR